MSESACAPVADRIVITFPDGKTRDYTTGVTGAEIADSIAKSLAKAAIAVKIDGVLSDLSLPIHHSATVAIVKREDPEGLELIRHDAAHIMAEAVQKLFPGTQVTIGPTVENGFYYDFFRNQPFTTEDFDAIEAEMRRIVERGSDFVREVWSREKAIAYFKDKGEHFKVELIQDLPGTEDIKIYRQGDWLDLCRGPHMANTRQIGTAFKLMKVAGAYWRGDSNKQMLTRIYATAWRTDDELKAHLHQLEEAEKRDHRKIGKEMDLFHLQEEAHGSVFWHPKGWTIWVALESYMRRRLQNDGYKEVKTPQLMDSRFWEASGHWGKYRENMFVVPDVVPNTEEGGKVFKEDPKSFMALKPMNCPAHVQIFKQGLKSYRDLPLRLAEFGCCHRNEAHGALHGIMRVRQFTQDDAHIFCREDQIQEECIKFCELTRAVYKDLGMDNFTVRLETRPEKRIGSDELWDKAEGGLKQALEKLGMPYTIAEGDGAFYGPKLAFIIRDAIGREWGCGTIQLDFNLPERLDANYIGEDGQRHRPVMLHRAVLGAIERFIGIMLENYAGKLPMWLMPVQCVVASITGDADDYARKVYGELKKQGIRAELDLRNEKINLKVREHSLQKVPALFVVGAREEADQTIAIRRLGSDAQNIVKLIEAVEALANEAKPPY
ncbi:MAG: threonine--tRNA ligase [Alphaproteobacteria bacterium]|nr:threonine--tRNA ligase [Alphaproteobacteria bacterium]